MGFFSLRKLDDQDSQPMTGAAENSDKSVVKVIRSRFYGRKGKEKEQPITYIPQNASVAETLSAVGPSRLHVPATSSPLAANRTIRSRGATTLRRVQNAAHSVHNLPTIPSDKPLPSTPDMRQSPAAVSSPDEIHMNPNILPTAPPRKAADTVTVTLAQRLNELAAANAEGLLNDDEYRLLRQNLFERFATASEVPSESPIVPVARPRPKPPGPHTPDKMSSRPLSNFRVDLPRSPSTQSRYSITSGVASLFRKTSVTSGGHRDSDTASIWSKASGASDKFRFSRLLSRKSSSSSIHTTASRNHDTASISSRHTGVGHSHSEAPRTPRRPLATPPSSFPTALKHPEPKHKGNIYDVFDEDHLSTAAEIREEIRAVEAEVRRLMDAFNGLEMTTLSKAQRSRGYSITQSDLGRGSNAGSVVESKWSADARSAKRVNIAESDAGSVRSGTSAVTGSAFPPRQMPRSKLGPGAPSVAINGPPPPPPPLPSRPSSLRRKNSGSSNKSHSKRGKTGGPAVPVPAIPSHVHLSRADPANNSSVSLARSTNITMPMSEDDSRSVARTVVTVTRLDDEVEEENEMEVIRQRREEVQMRYGARLDYLRAKLKSAELHEKLRRR